VTNGDGHGIVGIVTERDYLKKVAVRGQYFLNVLRLTSDTAVLRFHVKKTVSEGHHVQGTSVRIP